MYIILNISSISRQIAHLASQNISYQNIVGLDKDSEIHLITHKSILITEF